LNSKKETVEIKMEIMQITSNPKIPALTTSIMPRLNIDANVTKKVLVFLTE
jgi:predicted transcriptional regulator